MKVNRIAFLPGFLVLFSLLVGCGGFHGIVTPTISSITPSTVAAGSATFTLTVNGTNFISGTQILWDGAALTTTVVSNSQLTAQVTAAQIANPGTVSIRVMKPDTTTSGTMN